MALAAGLFHTLGLFSVAASRDALGRNFVRMDVRQRVSLMADATERGPAGIFFEKYAAAA